MNRTAAAVPVAGIFCTDSTVTAALSISSTSPDHTPGKRGATITSKVTGDDGFTASLCADELSLTPFAAPASVSSVLVGSVGGIHGSAGSALAV